MSVAESLIPENEAERLEAIRRYDVLDTPPDGAFERLTALAAKHFGTPIAVVSIVDEDRIWFKSHHGIDVEQIGRDPGLCASAILQPGAWVVENAETDPRTLANPLVAGDLGLRFYAGAPLTTSDGHRLGTLCVIDQEPRPFGEDDSATLVDMAAIVMDELELRLAARRVVDQARELQEQSDRVASVLRESLLPSRLPDVSGAELAALYVPAFSSQVGGDFYDVFEAGGRLVLAVGDVSGKGPEAAAVTALVRYTIRTATLAATSPASVLEILNRAMLIGQPDNAVEHFCTVLLVMAERTPDGLSLAVASAGHPAPVVARPGGEITEVDASGTPAGWLPEAKFQDTAVELVPGDLLLLYTDGISEARTPDGMLGMEGIVGCIEDVPGLDPTAVVARLRARLADDDVTARDDAAALAMLITKV